MYASGLVVSVDRRTIPFFQFQCVNVARLILILAFNNFWNSFSSSSWKRLCLVLLKHLIECYRWLSFFLEKNRISIKKNGYEIQVCVPCALQTIMMNNLILITDRLIQTCYRNASSVDGYHRTLSNMTQYKRTCTHVVFQIIRIYSSAIVWIIRCTKNHYQAVITIWMDISENNWPSRTNNNGAKSKGSAQNADENNEHIIFLFFSLLNPEFRSSWLLYILYEPLW